jgi:hypothetical protein
MDAVTHAVRQRRERENPWRRKQGLAAQLLRIGQRCAAHIKPPVAAKDHGTLLYDRAGLPK